MKKLINLLIATSLLCACTLTQAIDVNNNPQVNNFINMMVKKHQFNRKKLDQLFKQVKLQPKIVTTMDRPAEARLTWEKYRAIFITKKRIKLGVRFWNQYQKSLTRAKKQYGVDPKVIVAIIGVESYYGMHAGNHRVIDALSTLAFNYPRRQKFFSSELEHFLLLSREQKLNPLKLTGSYAGAIGLPQFMPSSYRHYAVDFSGTGSINLVTDRRDVIGSIANYLKQNGWQKNQPIAEKITYTGDKLDNYINKGGKPKLTINQMNKNGVRFYQKYPSNTKTMLLQLAYNNNPGYWVGFNNFYCIMTYNPRVPYAMVVYQLAEKIQQQHNRHHSK